MVKTVVIDTDLKEPSMSGKDPLERFELSLPFCRSLINTFADHARKAEKAAGGQGFVTIETLQAQFTSNAWIDLKSRNTVLVRMLLTDIFKNPEKN